MNIDQVKTFIERGQRAQRALDLAVRDLFLLIEGRGFWREYRRDQLTWTAGGAVHPKGQTWHHMRFAATGDRRTFICAEPAIGPANGSVDEFYRPGGWLDPETP